MHYLLLGRQSIPLYVPNRSFQKPSLSRPLLQAASIFLVSLEVTMRNKKQYRILNLNPTWSQSSQETIFKREKLALD